MLYLMYALVLFSLFMSTNFLVTSFTALISKNPVHLFGARFSKKNIADISSFNQKNALILFIMSIPGFCGSLLLFYDRIIGICVLTVGNIIVLFICFLLLLFVRKMHTKKEIQSFMFSVNKNHTTIKLDFYKKDNFVESFEYISINGSENIINSNLKSKVLFKIRDFVDYHDLNSWNGFSQRNGEINKGIEWKIRIVYSDGEVIFAFGKDAYPTHGKQILDQLNDLLNNLFIKMKV